MDNGFLDGFAVGANISRDTAESHWAAFASMLTAGERKRIERGGKSSGLTVGREYREGWAA